MSVGISDISLYFPQLCMNLEEIAHQRIKEDPHWVNRMPRALASTGQKSMRFPRFWEDSITLAAEACRALLEQQKTLALEKIRFLTLGTETSVDMSKPGSNYVLGILKKAGYQLSSKLTSFQVQHACAGGTLGMLGVAGLLEVASLPGESGIVLTSDIARYQAPSTAEVTQGAGAVGLLIEKNPKLLTIDLKTAGFHSEDVDDFFRPLGSTIAKVKGGYSLQCYHESFLAAFEDHCERAGTTPQEEIESIDLWTLHVPYSLMPVGAMLLLLKTHLGLEEPEARAYLEKKNFFPSLHPASLIGNIYTGSLYLSLAYSLSLSQKHGSLVGKKVLMASYGSGNTMVVLTGNLQPQADEVVSRWKVDSLINEKTNSTYEEYLGWIGDTQSREEYLTKFTLAPPPPGRIHLASLREDGYREYNL